LTRVNSPAKDGAPDTQIILLIDEDVIARAAVANYLRECGFHVIETDAEDDGKNVLNAQRHPIDIAICAPSSTRSSEHFDFVRWLRAHHPQVRLLIAANVEKEAKLAAEICEDGPHLRKPYEHQALLDWIKRLRA
jgi:DNA-binding NarL/FixJ family response regulator